ncbi:hypothetical protein PVAND_001204 [Polypedilum vanderplanki]|uniref:Elongator complex protein 5 n=1 Tax=Polypedilum vanderplanki TaxID=319348 RepID=A0A9J6BMN0_POLVA|nr:hypothetical protein PVAND_001204 [Polypedilum vanderplanki]
MISTQIIGNYKFVLFVDDVGIERNSVKILDNILREANLLYEINDGSVTVLKQTNVILEAISRLELEYNEKDIFTNIQKLKLNENVSQIFAWISSNNVHSKILIPFLEHMSELIVTIKSNNQLSILSKSKSGNVKLKEYHHELMNNKTMIKEIKIEKVQEQKEDVNVDNIGTFKIGQFTAEELEAKRNLKLPFEKINSINQEKKEAKIIYTPDNVDDFDEEDDPDNDLQFI